MLRSVLLKCSNMRVLGLDPSKVYTHAEVKDAFRAKAKEHHPDVAGGSDVKFRELHSAYQTITSEGCRDNQTSHASSSGVHGTHYSGDNEVYGSSNRTYRSMYETWHPEANARASSAHREDMKWYTFSKQTPDGFEDNQSSRAAASSSSGTFRNPYGGEFTGPRGHERDDRNSSTRSFYRSYSSSGGSYENKYHGTGFTKEEVNEAIAKNRVIFFVRRLKAIFLVFLSGYIGWTLLSSRHKLAIAKQQKEQGYSEDYVASLPNRVEERLKKQEADDARRLQINLTTDYQRKVDAFMSQQQTRRKAAKVVAATYRGKPFTAEGLEELRSSRSGRITTAVAAASSSLLPAQRRFSSSSVLEDDDLSYEAEES